MKLTRETKTTTSLENNEFNTKEDLNLKINVKASILGGVET